MGRKRIKYKAAEVKRLFEAFRPAEDRGREVNGRPTRSSCRLPDWETLLAIDRRAERATLAATNRHVATNGLEAAQRTRAIQGEDVAVA